MGSRANLKPFRPGESGNPAGRPKGRSLTARLRDAVEKEKGGVTVGDRLVLALLTIAESGDRQAIKDIFDRLDGKVPDRIQTEEAAPKPTLSDVKAALRKRHRPDTV